MMQKLSLLFCLIPFTVFTQDFRTTEGLDNKTYRISGSVYKLTEISYALTDTNGYIQKDGYGFYGNSEGCVEATFSEKGVLTEEKYFTCGDTNEYNLWKYEYSKNKKISCLKFSTNKDPIEKNVYYIYDKKGRLISTGREKDPAKNFYRIVYSSKPEMKQENHYDKNRNIHQRLEYIYENGNRIEFRHYKNGHLYNKNRGEIKSDVKNSDSMVMLYRYVYEFDEKGRERKMMRIEEEYEEREDSTIYIYNEEGQKTESFDYDSKGVVYLKYEFQYDKFGNETLLKYIYMDDDETDITSYEYTYDSNHNWIKKTIYSNQVPIFQVERSIIYYE